MNSKINLIRNALPPLRRENLRELTFMVAICIAHLVIVGLLISAIAESDLLPTRPPLSLMSRNIVDSDQAPLLAVEPADRPVASDVIAPTFEVEGSAPSNTVPSSEPVMRDPFAGAAPSYAEPSQPLTEGRRARRPLQGQQGHGAGLISDPNAGREFSIWIAELATLFKTRNFPVPSQPIRVTVFAQPAGGFTSARMESASGDATIDYEIIASVMQHQELVRAGEVIAPTWFSLPALDFKAAEEAAR